MLAAASQYNQFNDDDPSILSAVDSVDESAEAAGRTLEYRLDCTKIRDTFAIKQQPWRGSVAGQVKQYYALESKKEKPDGESHGHRDATA